MTKSQPRMVRSHNVRLDDEYTLELGTGFAFVGRQKEVVVSGKTRRIDMLFRDERDNPTIGLLICKDRDRTEVQWTLEGIQTPMGVAVYDNVTLERVRSQLPTDEQIQQRLEQAEREFILTQGHPAKA